jgi:hypothetical protein
LYSGSKYFEDLIKDGKKEITIPKDVDIKAFSNIIEFLYTGLFEYSDSSDLLQFVILSATVKFLLIISINLKI